MPIGQHPAPPHPRPRQWHPLFVLGVSAAIVAVLIFLTRSKPPDSQVGGSQSPVGNTSLTQDYQPLVGNADVGVDVFIQGDADIDLDPPKYLFTILDPLVSIDGTNYMRVRYPSGTTELKNRDALVFDPHLWVRK